MQKHIVKIVVGMSLLASVANVYAVNAGFYLGGQAGVSNLHNVPRDVQGSTTTIPQVRPKNTGIGARIFAGYQLNPYFGLEGGYTYYSPSQYKTSAPVTCSTPTIKTQALDFVGKGIVPIQDFALFAKAGVAIASVSSSGSLNTSTTMDSCGSNSRTTVFRPTVGLGASYDLTQNWVADISWSRIISGSNIRAADLIALGLSYHFTDKFCGQFLC